jgi:ribosomal-protein-alanine N-acetyltransferase
VAGWSIRALDESLIDGVSAIEEASFRQPWRRMSFVNELSCRQALNVAVVEPHGGPIIAYACLRLNPQESHLLKIAVAPACRRRGLASWLLKRCSHLAQRQNARTMYLEVRRSNRAARNLYVKLGFKTIGTRAKYYTDTGEDALLMMKRLKEAQ